MAVDFIGYIYAVIVASGGLIGYFKADSVASLVSGILFGIALAVGAYLASGDSPNYIVQLIATLLLFGLMAYKYYSSRKFMPAGIICVLSILMFIKIALGMTGVFPASKNQIVRTENA